MTFKEQQDLLLSLLRDNLGSADLWTPGGDRTGIKLWINEGEKKIASLLPRASVEGLLKEKTIDLVNGQTGYGIEHSSDFNLSDFLSADDLYVYCGSGSNAKLREAVKVDRVLGDTDNVVLAAAAVRPVWWVVQDSANRHEIEIRPSPSTQGNGLKLLYRALPATLSGDTDTSKLPPHLHVLSVYEAAHIGAIKGNQYASATLFGNAALKGVADEYRRLGLQPPIQLQGGEMNES